ncbi:MAG: hypothetical protein JKP95_00435 [Oceanicaulis sp.]|nr:hypothetical protein [Oceanicaulis sp.]
MLIDEKPTIARRDKHCVPHRLVRAEAFEDASEVCLDPVSYMVFDTARLEKHLKSPLLEK